MKAIHVVLFIMLYKVAPTFKYFKFVDETLVCDHSNESYWTVLSRVVCYMLYKVALTFKYFKFVDETLVCDHSNESYWTVLSRVVCYML